jgi:outer membrane protein assembly factor BamB
MRVTWWRPWAYLALGTAVLMALALLLPRWLDHPTIPLHTAVYISDQGERLSSVDPRTGKVLWQKRLAGLGTGAALVGDTVYTGGSAGYVQAFDAATGAKRWTVKITSDSEMPTILSVGEGTVYVGANSFGAQSTGHLFALRATDGTVLWSQSFDGTVGALTAGRHTGAPTRDGDILFVGWSKSGHGALSALRARDGSTLWSTLMPGQPSTQPVVVGDSVYMSTELGYVIAYDAASGAERWRYQPPHFEGGLSGLDTTDGLIYVCVQRTFFALRATDGSLRWQVTVPGSPERSHQHYAPAVVHGTLYAVANNDETMYALAPDSGAIRWQFDGIDYGTAMPVVDRGVTYVITGDGSLIALRESDGKVITRLNLGLFDEGPIAVRGAP